MPLPICLSQQKRPLTNLEAGNIEHFSIHDESDTECKLEKNIDEIKNLTGYEFWSSYTSEINTHWSSLAPFNKQGWKNNFRSAIAHLFKSLNT